MRHLNLLAASKSSKDVRVADYFIGSASEHGKSLMKNQRYVNHLADAKQSIENAAEESTKVSNLLVRGSLSTDEDFRLNWATLGAGSYILWMLVVAPTGSAVTGLARLIMIV